MPLGPETVRLGRLPPPFKTIPAEDHLGPQSMLTSSSVAPTT